MEHISSSSSFSFKCWEYTVQCCLFTLTLYLLASGFKKWKVGSFAYFDMHKVKQVNVRIVRYGAIQHAYMKMWVVIEFSWCFIFLEVLLINTVYSAFLFWIHHLFFIDVNTSVTFFFLETHLTFIFLSIKLTWYIMDISLFHILPDFFVHKEN